MSIFLTDGSRDAELALSAAVDLTNNYSELHIVIVEHRLPTDGSVSEAPSSGALVP
jgi:hypothetical protein